MFGCKFVNEHVRWTSVSAPTPSDTLCFTASLSTISGSQMISLMYVCPLCLCLVLFRLCFVIYPACSSFVPSLQQDEADCKDGNEREQKENR